MCQTPNNCVLWCVLCRRVTFVVSLRAHYAHYISPFPDIDPCMRSHAGINEWRPEKRPTQNKNCIVQNQLTIYILSLLQCNVVAHFFLFGSKDVLREDRAIGDPLSGDESNFLHPVLYYYQDPPAPSTYTCTCTRNVHCSHTWYIAWQWMKILYRSTTGIYVKVHITSTFTLVTLGLNRACKTLDNLCVPTLETSSQTANGWVAPSLSQTFTTILWKTFSQTGTWCHPCMHERN